MEIVFKNKKLENVCSSAEAAQRQYGREMADKIHQRIDEIRAADTVEMLVQFHIGRCHPLSNNRKGQYAMDLVQPYRLIFEKLSEDIQIVRIIEIKDYH